MAARDVIERLQRQWQILAALRPRKLGVTVKVLLGDVGCSRATLYRDLKILVDSPAPVDRRTVNGEVRYFLTGEWPGVIPSAEQLLALATARAMLSSLEGTAVIAQLDQLLGRKPKKPPRLAVAADPLLHRPEDVGTIERGIQHNLRVRIAYHGTKDVAPRARVIEPVELRRAAGGWYLTAWDPEADGGWRTFKLARIANAELLDENAAAHPPYDGVREYAFSVGIWSGDEQEVTLLIDADHARFVREYPLNGVQKIEERADGSIVLRSRVAGTEEVQRWIMRWGRHAEALEPPVFRRQMADELTAMRARYDGALQPVSSKLRMRGRKMPPKES